MANAICPFCGYNEAHFIDLNLAGPDVFIYECGNCELWFVPKDGDHKMIT